MKKLIIVIFFLPFLSISSILEMPRVDARLFINAPNTDLEEIYEDRPEELEKAVYWLFISNKLSHDLTQSFNFTNKFVKYWNIYKKNWHLIDMNQDGQAELIFSGKPAINDEKEMFSLYVKFGSIWKEIYWDDGHLLAFKIHPRTKEILLYHHRYPCCSQSTHSIIRLRFVENKLHQMKRYFLARNTGMKGQFFPSKSKFPKKYRYLKRKTMVYWSKGKITSNASQYVPTNEIIHFPIGSGYKILAREQDWLYVQTISPPLVERSLVVNPLNLKDSKFFGWILVH